MKEGENSDGALTRERKFKSDERRNKEVYEESRSFRRSMLPPPAAVRELSSFLSLAPIELKQF